MGRRSVVTARAPVRDADHVAAELAALRALPLAELRQRWRALGGASLPKPLPTFLVLRLVAHKLQAQRFGDLGPDLRKALVRRGRGEEINLPIPDASRAPHTLAAGTLLTREWAGHVQHVMVLADGFAWNGRTFGSLSEVARAITGTRWSGPTFFGLSRKGRSQTDETEGTARTGGGRTANAQGGRASVNSGARLGTGKDLRVGSGR